MKVLIVSDIESKYIWNFYDPEKFKDIELIISAGDLKQSYLSYLVTMTNVPLLYIHGNHDQTYIENPPEGCISIDDKVFKFKGFRIAGFGGSKEYSGGPFQFTELQMAMRYLKNYFSYSKGVDVFVSHSSPFGLGDGTDFAHIGFKFFLHLLKKFKPKFWIHGHQHLNYKRNQRIIHHIDTTIINAHDYYIIEL